MRCCRSSAKWGWFNECRRTASWRSQPTHTVRSLYSTLSTDIYGDGDGDGPSTEASAETIETTMIYVIRSNAKYRIPKQGPSSPSPSPTSLPFPFPSPSLSMMAIPTSSLPPSPHSHRRCLQIWCFYRVELQTRMLRERDEVGHELHRHHLDERYS